MKRRLATLLLAAFSFVQSACSSMPEYKCPKEEDILNAGLYMYSGLKVVRPEQKDSVGVARLQYEYARAHYFEGDDPNHYNKHTYQAIATAFEYYNLPPDKRAELSAMLRLVEGTEGDYINDFPWTSEK